MHAGLVVRSEQLPRLPRGGAFQRVDVGQCRVPARCVRHPTSRTGRLRPLESWKTARPFAQDLRRGEHRGKSLPISWSTTRSHSWDKAAMTSSSVLVGTDLSDASFPAIRQGAAWAKHHGMSLVIAHIHAGLSGAKTDTTRWS